MNSKTITATTTNAEIYDEVCRHQDAISGRFDSQAKRDANAAECDSYMQHMFAQRRAARQFAAEYEAALAVGCRYEATGDVRVFA